MNELNDVIDQIFMEQVDRIRNVLIKNLMRDCIDLVVSGIVMQASKEEIKILAGKIDQQKLYDHCLNHLIPSEEKKQEKFDKKEKIKNIQLAIDVVINALDELISSGDLKVQGVLDKNKLYDVCLKNEVV